jgi:Cu(I)/Ag(I) efflux system protein CusF
MGESFATKTGAGTGVVTAVDQKAGTVTLKHGPIPEIGWPAMTMTFKADPPSLLDGVKTGEQVRFTLQGAGMAYRLTAIAPR